MKNSKPFVQKVKLDKISSKYKINSFDQTISIILNRIYDNSVIITDITQSEIKELLYLCTKNAHFSFDNNIYIQNDSVAMGSP